MNIYNFNLSLSGGAALGYAHVGVLEYLYQFDIHPKSIYGVSMGAIVGSIEALDISNKEKLKLFDDSFDTISWIRPSFVGSLISTAKVEDNLYKIFKNMKFSDLSRDLHIGATNYHTGELTVFNKENDIKIVDAILASMAVPSVFPARVIDNTVYVDGYISSNIIVDKADKDSVNLVVNVTGKNSFKTYKTKKLTKLSIAKNLERSIRILIYNQCKEILKDTPNLVLLEPDLHKFKTSHFTKYEQIREIGKITAKEALDINKLLI